MTKRIVLPRELPVGAFFLRHVDGWIGRSISAMQGFVRGGSYWTHAGLIVDGGWFIQGQPGGAKLYPIGDLFDGKPLLVSDAPVQIWGVGSAVRLETGIRSKLAECGRALRDAKYSYLDYPALGVAEWARKHPHSLLLRHLSSYLRDYINCSGHLICSALVDRACLNAGIHLFTDGRMAGDVTPEDLAWLAYQDGRKPLIDTREDSPQEVLS